MTGSQVLIVDDDPALLEALSAALRLRMDGVAVETCDSARAALDRIGTTEYDAIVADIKMPGMDGLELLAEIRRLRPDTPTLLITGHGEHDLAVQALRGGAQDYVQKPIDRDYFVASLGRAIQCHQLSGQVARQRQALEHHVGELEQCLQERTHELREFFHREQQARVALDEAHGQLEEAQRQREEFITMVAHELSGPLTVVLGYAEALGRPKTSPDAQRRACEAIVSEARRMVRLVADLAAAANLAAGRFEIQPAPCDQTTLVGEQIELARVTTDHHTIRLEAPSEVVCGLCDRDRVAQLLTNLLANAIKYTPGGAIQVRLWAEGEDARLSVSDEGPGISPEDQSAIFEPHVRLVPSEAAGESKGAGLGLHIARGIVQAHGGRIWIESPDGHGATFHVALPLAPTAATKR
jgi:two-component system, sensor histidine kinase and response regulator